MGFFSIEGKFFKALTKAGDFFILGILGAIFSLPLITIGASITAVYYVALKEVRDEEGYVWRAFWKSWKQNMKQSIVIELIIAVLATILFVDVRVCYDWSSSLGTTALGNTIRVLMFVSLGFVLILVATSIYVFPVLAKFDNTIIETLKNSLVLSMHHFPQTLAMIVINGALIFLSVKFFTAFIVTVPVIYYVNAFILSRIFQPYVEKKDDQEIEENVVSDDTKDDVQ